MGGKRGLTKETENRDYEHTDFFKTVWQIERKKMIPDTITIRKRTWIYGKKKRWTKKEKSKRKRWIKEWYQTLWSYTRRHKYVNETIQYEWMNARDLYHRLWKLGENMNNWKQGTFTRDCENMERIRINAHARPLPETAETIWINEHRSPLPETVETWRQDE